MFSVLQLAEIGIKRPVINLTHAVVKIPVPLNKRNKNVYYESDSYIYGWSLQHRPQKRKRVESYYHYFVHCISTPLSAPKTFKLLTATFVFTAM